MHITIIIALIVPFILPSCGGSDPEIGTITIDDTKVVDHATMYAASEFENGMYCHHEIGFSVRCPKNWTRWSRDQIKNQIYQAALAETGNITRAKFEASDVPGSFQLLTLFKNSSNNSGQYNPSMVVDAKSAMVLSEKGITDFDAWLALKQNVESPRTAELKVVKITGAELECWHARLIAQYPNGVKIYQDTYDYDLGDYWITVVVSGSTVEEVEQMQPYALSLRLLE